MFLQIVVKGEKSADNDVVIEKFGIKIASFIHQGDQNG
jgi:hypothetical protein